MTPLGYVIFTEYLTDYSIARSRAGAQFMAVWIRLATWLTLCPQRVMIVELPQQYLPYVSGATLAAIADAQLRSKPLNPTQ
jgi:hypothetical protein